MSAMAELEFKVDGHTYRAGKLSTFDQLHVASQWRDALLGLALAKKNRPKEVTDAGFRDMMGVVFTGAAWAPERRVARACVTASLVCRYSQAEWCARHRMAGVDHGRWNDDVPGRAAFAAPTAFLCV